MEGWYLVDEESQKQIHLVTAPLLVAPSALPTRQLTRKRHNGLGPLATVMFLRVQSLLLQFRLT